MLLFTVQNGPESNGLTLKQRLDWFRAEPVFVVHMFYTHVLQLSFPIYVLSLSLSITGLFSYTGFITALFTSHNTHEVHAHRYQNMERSDVFCSPSLFLFSYIVTNSAQLTFISVSFCLRGSWYYLHCFYVFAHLLEVRDVRRIPLSLFMYSLYALSWFLHIFVQPTKRTLNNSHCSLGRRAQLLQLTLFYKSEYREFHSRPGHITSMLIGHEIICTSLLSPQSTSDSSRDVVSY